MLVVYGVCYDPSMSTNQKPRKCTATFITKGKGFAGTAAAYKLNPPFHGVEYVAVSTVTEEEQADSMGASLGQTLKSAGETALVPVTPDGEVDLETLFGIAYNGDKAAFEAWSTAAVPEIVEATEYLGRFDYEVQF